MNAITDKRLKRQTRNISQVGRAMKEIVKFLAKHNGEYVSGDLVVVCVSDSNPKIEISNIFQAIRCLVALNAIGSLYDDDKTLTPSNKFKLVE